MLVPSPAVSIVGVGTATPPTSYTQVELLDIFKVTDRRIRSLFLNGAIKTRHLVLPDLGGDRILVHEDQGGLIRKHKKWSVALGADAIRACLEGTPYSISDISHLCCVTTTGFICPGLTAHLCRELQLKDSCTRLDVVGMGCNAGLNALQASASWALANPRQLAIIVCAEICSAAYVFDNSIRTAVVNSLFGDGAAAVAILAGTPDAQRSGPQIVKFQSRIITDAIEAMRYDWEDAQQKFSFYLDPNIPYVIGANVESVVDLLLKGSGVRRSDIRHWLIHSGGKKVIDAVRVNLGLSANDIRHTVSMLRDFGNLSSGAFLFSYEQLIKEGQASAGDAGIMMTMGPGSTIETALLRW